MTGMMVEMARKRKTFLNPSIVGTTDLNTHEKDITKCIVTR